MSTAEAARTLAARRREIDRAPILNRVKQWLACRRLNKLVTAKRNSFETLDYARRRAAALKATRPN